MTVRDELSRDALAQLHRDLSVLGAVAGLVAGLDADGGCRVLVAAGYPPELVETWREIPRGLDVPLTRALRTGQAIFVASVGELHAEFPVLADVPTAGRHAIAALPLLTETGRCFAVLGVSYDESTGFDEPRRALLGDVALAWSRRLPHGPIPAPTGSSALPEQRAAALGRSAVEAAIGPGRVVAAEAAARSARLLDVAVALGRALRVTDVADVVTAACAAGLGTMTAGIVLYDEVRDALRFVTMKGYPRSVVEGWREFSADADIAITEALGTGLPVYEPSVADYLRRHPHVAADTRAAGIGATASLPLVIAGRRIGVLALAWDSDREFGAEEREFLETLAGLAAQALERARLFEREASIAETLQRALLPDWLPDLPGITVGALYLPAEDGSEVGGDFYDAFLLPDGRVLMALGDVTGKGVAAARVMGRMRHGLRGIALATHAPAGELLDSIDDLLVSYSDDRLVTLAVAIIDTANRRVEVASAGHLPLLVLAPDGSSEFVEAGASHPLGLPIARLLPAVDARRSQATFPIEPGTTLVLYSDGLVESRSSGLDVGLPRLQAIAAALPPAQRRDPQVLCEQLAAALLGDGHEDDVAVLALRLDEPGE